MRAMEDCCSACAAAGLMRPEPPSPIMSDPSAGYARPGGGRNLALLFLAPAGPSPVLQGHVEQAAAADARVIGPGDQLATLSGHGLGADGLLARSNQGVHQLGRIAGPELRQDTQGSLRTPGCANPGRGKLRSSPLPHGASLSAVLPAWLETWLWERTGTRTKKWKNVGKPRQQVGEKTRPESAQSRKSLLLCKTHRTQRHKHYRSRGSRGAARSFGSVGDSPSLNP